MKDTKNFWPFCIALFMTIMVCMIILTIYISIKYKPDNDNAYFSSREIVDKEINTILQQQQELEEKYDFYIVSNDVQIPLQRKVTRKSNPLELKLGDSLNLNLKVITKDNSIDNTSFKDFTARAYITRFADSKDDIDIGLLESKNNEFFISNIKLKQGDWKLLVEFIIDDKKAYFEYRIYVKG
ncbi:MAG: hypothetical protein K2P17_02900 [Helicobacteraceae bacterium]|nr:hypothetical protein [Helicobacteraceae bacterium]